MNSRHACCLVLAFLAAAFPAAAAAAGPPAELRLAVILSRHGVRPPIVDPNRQLGRFGSQPWPQWEVPGGYLTPHGKELMRQMGVYYRAYYVRAGLLSGDAAADAGRIFFRCDSDERTIETGAGLAAGMVPGAAVDLHHFPQDANDPLFRRLTAGAVHPDLARAESELRGRVGGDPANPSRAHAAELALLDRILRGPGGAAQASCLGLPARIIPDHRAAGMATLNGPLGVGHLCAENFLLEYADGKPMADVAWGRADPAALTELMTLEGLFFDLTETSLYRAQAQISNLASHLRSTFEQAASGRPVAGAFGRPSDRLVVLVGHDTNLANLGGLLGLSWWLPGTCPNPTLPGGALVFELWRGSQGDFVRVRYVSQSLDQMRNSQPLSLEHPPETAPIFVPGCSGAGMAAPYGKVRALLDRVIDPSFVERDAPSS